MHENKPPQSKPAATRQPPAVPARDVEKARAEYLEVTASGAAPTPVVGPPPPPERKVVGHGACPGCGQAGPIYAEDSGDGYSRRLVFSACVCRKTK